MNERSPETRPPETQTNDKPTTEGLAEMRQRLSQRSEEARRERERNISQGVQDNETILADLKKNDELLSEVNITITEYENYMQSNDLDDAGQKELTALRQTKAELEAVQAELEKHAQTTFDKPGVADRLRDQADLENAQIIEKEAMEKYGQAMDQLGEQITALGKDMWKYENVTQLSRKNLIHRTRENLQILTFDTANEKMGKNGDDFAREIHILNTESITSYHERLGNILQKLTGFGNRKKRAVIEAILAHEGFDAAEEAEVQIQDTSQSDKFNRTKAEIYERYKNTMTAVQKEYGRRLKIDGRNMILLRDLKHRIFKKLNDAHVSAEHHDAGKIFYNLPELQGENT